MKMDSLVRDIIQWDVSSWSKILDHWDKNLDWSQVSNCLELGSREGGLSLWLALKGKNVVCSDLNNIKNTAAPLHLKYGIEEHIRYQDIDATNIPYQNHFDVIVFKSILGGIGRKGNHTQQEQVFNEIYKALKPGGKLLFAENLIASAFHQKIREMFTEWDYYWNYLSIKDMERYLKPFEHHDLNTTGVFATFGRTENQRNFLSKFDNVCFNKICPDNWKYISYGIAIK